MRWKARTIGDGPQRVVVREHDGIVELVAGGLVLLSSAALETELAFGRFVASAPTPSAARSGGERPGRRPRVLIGGLGFGATLRGVLDVVDADAEVIVAEKVAMVETLVRGELAHLSGNALADPRVKLVRGDVGQVIDDSRGLSAVLLDVDNGPHWASFRGNARLYTPAGLASARRALGEGGKYAVWSGYRADAFLRRLGEAGFERPSAVPLHERGRVRARAYMGEKVSKTP